MSTSTVTDTSVHQQRFVDVDASGTPTSRSFVIELPMLNVPRFLAISCLGGLSVHTTLYPLLTIRTRLQTQHQRQLYTGLMGALRSIVKEEGFRALYAGFVLKTSQTLAGSQIIYMFTYESIRSLLNPNRHSPQSASSSSKPHAAAAAASSAFPITVSNASVRALIAGGCASLAAQTISVPVDIVTQYLQLFGRVVTTSRSSGVRVSLGSAVLASLANERDLHTLSGFGRSKAVVRTVYSHYGLRGFYQGYLTSLSFYVPNAALWWFFYDLYGELLLPRLEALSPGAAQLPLFVLKAPMAALSGFTTAFFTNVIDTVRVRVQTQQTRFVETVGTLWREERLRMFTLGLSSRLAYSTPFSFFIMLLYELVKQSCLKPEYSNQIRLTPRSS